MRARRLLAACSCAALCAVAAARADGDVAITVGRETVSRADLERRVRAVPALQLATLGKTPLEQRRAFVDRVVVPELLFAQAAAADQVAKRAEVRVRLDDALRAALMEELRREADRELGDAEIARYFEDNKSRLEVPERIHVQRILVATREDADAVLALAKRPGGEREWPKLARERSLDKATHERGGDLGFLAADGQSHEVTVKAEPELFAAARKVKNGQLVPEPVPVDGKFAVVWRRGSTSAVTRTLEQEAASIRGVLVRQRTESKVKALLDAATKAKVSDVKDELLAWLDSGTAPTTSARRQVSPRPSGRGAAVPRPSPVGPR